MVQYGGELAIGDNASHHFDYKGGTFYVTGRTNHGTEEIWPSFDVDWVHLGAKTRGMSDFQFGPIYVDENTSTQPRETTFGIYDDNIEICKITVTQEGCPAELTKSISTALQSPSWFKTPFTGSTKPILPSTQRQKKIVIPFR